MNANTYFCPRGCNACDEQAAIATGFECGACGCRMTTDHEAFDDAHERRELDEIEALEADTTKK